MNTFVQVDTDGHVKAILQTEDDTVEGFVLLKEELPPPNDGNVRLMYDEAKGACYFEEAPISDKERIKELEQEIVGFKQESEDLKSSVTMLEDIVMMLTTP